MLLCVLAGIGGGSSAHDRSAPSPRSHADALLTALAVAFGPTDREPAFDALRPKLVRAALVPSRVFDDASAWTESAEETRGVGFEGRRAGERYRIGVRAHPPDPTAPGDYRGRLRLRRLAPGRFEWRVREELAVGGIRGAELAAAATWLFRGAEAAPAGDARAPVRAALPRAAAAWGRAFSLEELRVDRAPDGATSLTLAALLVPERLERDFPRYARFLRKSATPVSFSIEALEAEGPRWWRLEGLRNRVTLQLRIHDGALAPLDAAPRRIPDRLRVRVDYTMKPGLFGVALHGLDGELELTRSERELGFRAGFPRAPDWKLPFIIEPFIRGPLHFPFEGEGFWLRFWLREEGEGHTLISREYRLGVRESWIVRWLGGFAGSTVSEFRKEAESEAERFVTEGLEALRDDVLALLAPQPVE
jgi:hypothetical protein